MSGICGLFPIAGTPATAQDVRSMTSVLQRRGPQRTGLWCDGVVGLGHTLLATTQEAWHEHLPLQHAASGCAITADVRLDNRDELLTLLGLGDRRGIGDAGLVLASYLAWGEACVQRLLGDFAFAIVDPRHRTLFCARDQMGMRPLLYHHSPGRFVAFASDPAAILVLPQTPYRIDEGRIADYLVTPLEGIDRTSTFFEDVHRLPPAHTLTVTTDRFRVRRYWQLEPRDELRLASDREYGEAFLAVFSDAVACRLRGDGPVGSMLSGGVDSGSVVAVASRSLAERGAGPLPTFSAVAPDPTSCVETRTIQAATAMGGLAPHRVSHDQLAGFEDLHRLTWALDEPFDAFMTLPRVMYLAGRRAGVRVLLDGVAGDTVLGEGDQLTRLLRSGRWLTAYREAVGLHRFWADDGSALRQLQWPLREAVVPDVLRRLRSDQRAEQALAQAIRDAPIRPDFARRIALGERLARLRAHAPDRKGSFSAGQARRIEHPFLVVGRERYDRVASALGMEPRDPFLDLRLLDFVVSLPGDQLLGGGWPKAILRRAMTSHLPDAVRYRRGKQHLGAAFTAAVVAGDPVPLTERLRGREHLIAPYVDRERAIPVEVPRDPHAEQYLLAQLAVWLDRYQQRPQPQRGPGGQHTSP
jgi:asparagine synthase (glutamine-hydrolysing)